ncbi:hypothetical protein [Methylobacterium organophilum]|uniref:Uncharacterized protein n=1 Tax=Methylobacterium organophilum TaxID=410 RepID=A0ABQ4T5K9_METOR|nr:hypothetical protein [Methylobacterium organophilum]UMY17035.1 hypothetical protein MMB17_20680 [Methylobacterium organophilum]GJE26940.1 hypothetical protein LKMONMHP_1794 [Methylobacterium organophilum]
MTARTLTAAALGLALGLSGATAFAQSYNAPAGIAPAVAPGGLQGRAALPNLAEANGGLLPGVAARGYDDGIATGTVRAPRGERLHSGR